MFTISFGIFFVLRLVNSPCPAIHLTPLMSDVLGKKIDCVSDQLFHLAQNPMIAPTNTLFVSDFEDQMLSQHLG